MTASDPKGEKSGTITSGSNLSFWLATVTQPEFETLDHSLNTDVLVIGGGIAGLTIAYILSKNHKVVLVEDGLIASGESGRTTAHLTNALDDRYFYIEEAFGEEGSRKAAESHTAAINWIESTVQKENIDCKFKRINGYLFLHPSDKRENLEKEFKACQKAGIQTKWLDEVPGIKAETGPCIEFPNQGQFHIIPYLTSLAKAAEKNGVKIYTKTHARHIDEDGAICNGHKVTAKQIVVATNTPVNDFVTMHTKQVPFRTYVIAAKVKKGSVEPALWWDTGNQDSKWFTAPYHYIRTAVYNEEYDTLIVGGEDHKTGQADKEDIPEESRYEALISWTKTHFPQAGEIINKWSGQIMETFDYMAFIGKNPGNKNVYIVTGDSGNGMTHGTLGGIIISDLINGIENPWSDLYSPKRIPLKFAGQFLKQQADVMLQFTDYFKKGDIKELDELAVDSGAVISKGLNKYAVYKDEKNTVHAFSAVCPHMGCVVQWNAEEKSFDCPCHGSRFTKDGEVINGPATVNLEKIKISE